MKIIKQYLGLQKEVYVICLCKAIDKLGALIGPMFTLILSVKLGFNAETIALWTLIYTAISFPVHLLGGRLADKVNKKMLINICDIASSVIFITCGIFSLTKVTVICYLAGAALQTFESPSYSVIIADITQAKDRDRAHSLSYLSANFGLILAPIIGGLLLENYANLIFLISGITQLISLAVFDIFIKETELKADKDNAYENVSQKKNLFSMLVENLPVLFFTLIMGMSMLAYKQFTYILPLDFAAAFNQNGEVIYGTVSAENCIVVLVATSVVTFLISKLKSIDKMMLGLVFEFVGFILFAFFIRSVAVCYVAGFVFTVGEIIETITSAPYYLNRVPANYRGRVNAFRETFVSLFVALGNVGVGKIYDSYGSMPTWCVIFGLLGIAVISFAVLRRYDKKRYRGLYS